MERDPSAKGQEPKAESEPKAPFTIGLIQDHASPDVAANLQRTERLVRDAAGKGAQIVCLKELFQSPYLCKSQQSDRFDLAESIPGPTTDAMQRLARELSIVMVVPIFERQAAGIYRNSAAIIDADGTLLGTYRKMHIPDDPLFNEKYYFTPGDAAVLADSSSQAGGFRVWKTRYATIGVLICWDQWYPEAARITALLGARVLFFPTAIGWHPAERAEWGQAQVEAWRTIQRSHAIANGVFVASPNRIGHEDEPGTKGLTFFGHSFIADPFGRYIAEAGESEEVLVAQCDPALIELVRRNWPFLRDRRVDAYRANPQSVSRRVIDSVRARFRMPAEWEPHRATWIAWPHHEPDWPGKFGPIPWVYAEIARVIALHEQLEILCHSQEVLESAHATLRAHDVRQDRVRLHVVPTDRVWLRDSAPIAVRDTSDDVVLLDWKFNAWAKYDNWANDDRVGTAVASITGLHREEPTRTDNGEPIVLEGGGIEVNGDGLLLVTEEWLLSDVQVRNPGLSRHDYERIFAEWLGIDRTIWLGEGCVGDDTHGHIDDIARFVSRDTVVLAVEQDPDDENHARSMDNLHRLEQASKAPGVAALHIVTLPFPRAVMMNGERLPASYANFYMANGVVLVPTFNDPNDRVALDILANLLPSHSVVGIHAVDLVWGLGTLHCLTQQEPAGPAKAGHYVP